jgi:hypothetical protein
LAIVLSVLPLAIVLSVLPLAIVLSVLPLVIVLSVPLRFMITSLVSPNSSFYSKSELCVSVTRNVCLMTAISVT